MATLSITKDWADGEVLLESDLDNIKDDLETFLNTTKINDDNIQNAGITASSKLIDASISTAKLANLSVTTAKVNDLAVTAAKLAADAVTTAKILDANVTKAKLAALATAKSVTSKSADYTVTTADDVIVADSSSATVTLTLPIASSATGMILEVIKTASGNTVVIDGYLTETINGNTTFTMNTQYEHVVLICTGSAWFISSQYIPGASHDPVVFRASRVNNISIPDSTLTTVEYSTVAVDNKSFYNTSSGQYTYVGPTAWFVLGGAALFEVGAGWNGDEEAYICYQKNSDSVVRLGSIIAQAAHAYRGHAGGTDMVQLTSGDTIRWRVYQTSGGTTALQADAQYNHVFLVKVY